MSLIPHNTVTNKVKEDGNISQNKPFLKKGKKKKSICNADHKCKIAFNAKE